MKNNKGFSLVEVIVGTVLLTISSIGIVQIYNLLMDRDIRIDYSIKGMYFNQFVFNLFNGLEESKTRKISTKFYIKALSDNNYEITNNPSYNSNKLNFFESSDSSDIKHEITLISINKIENIEYRTYKIYTNYNQNEQTTYLTK